MVRGAGAVLVPTAVNPGSVMVRGAGAVLVPTAVNPGSVMVRGAGAVLVPTAVSPVNVIVRGDGGIEGGGGGRSGAARGANCHEQLPRPCASRGRSGPTVPLTMGELEPFA